MHLAKAMTIPRRLIAKCRTLGSTQATAWPQVGTNTYNTSQTNPSAETTEPWENRVTKAAAARTLLGLRGGRTMARRFVGFAGFTVALAFAAGCAGTKEKPTNPDAASGGGGRDAAVITGAAGTNGAAGTGGSGTDGPGHVIGADALGDAACAAATQQAQQVPLDLYIMMDSSGSMTGTTSGGQSKWDAIRAALTAFLRDGQSAGLGVGLQYFPLLRPGVPASCEMNNECGTSGPCDLIRVCSDAAALVSCTTNADCRGMGTCVRLGQCGVTPQLCAPAGPTFACSAAVGDGCLPIAGYCRARDVCEAAPYATAAVEVAALPGAGDAHETALIDSLDRHVVDGLTPTAGALSGAIMHAQALARANPTHKLAVVLATDGLPSECTPVDIAGSTGIASIAAAAYAGTPAIATYVIGVFSPDEAVDAQSNLDMLAAAGGTGRAFVINTSQNVTQMFVSALNAVRSSGLACQYMLPAAAQDGGQLDYFSVNVQFTPSTGPAVTVGNVKDRASCSPTKGGWYYDADPAAGGTPQTISVCDTTCAQMKADPAGRVDVLLGCKTVIILD